MANSTYERQAPDYLPVWYNALDEEIGIMLRTDPKDASIMLSILYTARQQAADPELEKLIICQPEPGTFFIAHKSVELDD